MATQREQEAQRAEEKTTACADRTTGVNLPSFMMRGDKIRVSYASILSQVAVRRRYMRGKLPRPAQGQHHTASQFNTVMSLQQMCTLIVMNWGMFF